MDAQEKEEIDQMMIDVYINDGNSKYIYAGNDIYQISTFEQQKDTVLNLFVHHPIKKKIFDFQKNTSNYIKPHKKFFLFFFKIIIKVHWKAYKIWYLIIPQS